MERECNLLQAHEEEIRPVAPFDLIATVLKPSHFPSPNVQLVEGTWHQALDWQGLPLGITLRAAGPVDDPLVRVAVYAPAGSGVASLTELLAEIVHRYGMATDLRPFYDRFDSDEVLGPVLRRWRGMKVSTSASLYEFLVTTVLLQNATIRRTVQMTDNLMTRYGHTVTLAGRRMKALGHPARVAQAGEDDLRALKLGYRARTILRLTSSFAEGEVNEAELRRLDTDSLRERLLRLYGIGPASVGYLVFEVFHGYDTFDHVSPWEQKIFSRILFGESLVPATRIIETVNCRWQGWGMLAAHYLFEDLFWQRRQGCGPAWLDELIRL
ncbi:MAG: hypothetical protein RDU89_05025 [bacterium]|nr:hypothetical protein [bacterium]